MNHAIPGLIATHFTPILPGGEVACDFNRRQTLPLIESRVMNRAAR